jgi:hypothetical protein
MDSIESMPNKNSVTESDLEKARCFAALARIGGVETPIASIGARY